MDNFLLFRRIKDPKRPFDVNLESKWEVMERWWCWKCILFFSLTLFLFLFSTRMKCSLERFISPLPMNFHSFPKFTSRGLLENCWEIVFSNSKWNVFYALVIYLIIHYPSDLKVSVGGFDVSSKQKCTLI